MKKRESESEGAKNEETDIIEGSVAM